VIVLSAHVNVRGAAEQMGAVDWLRKPIDLSTLLGLIEERRC
jgi:FixJ family two-component response regulator